MATAARTLTGRTTSTQATRTKKGATAMTVQRRKPARTAKAAPKRAPVKIKYLCSGTTCKAAGAKNRHMSPGATVELSAANTDVTLDFSKYHGSPFVGAPDPISLTAGGMKSFVVSGTAAGPYPYKLKCKNCRGSWQGDPSMQVP